jgi:hypothetical protein
MALCRRASVSAARWIKVGPCGGDQRACSIGQYEEKLKLLAILPPAQHLQQPALEGVVRPDDRYLRRIAIEVVVGIVSTLPSTNWITDGW